MTTPTPQIEQLKEQAISQLNRQYANIKTRGNEWKRSYVEPAADIAKTTVSERPLTSLMVGVFASLALLPVLLFGLFAAGTFVVLVGGALTISLFWTGLLVLGAGILLALALFVAAFFSIGIWLWIVVTYASYRLLYNMYHAPSIQDGLQAFKFEIQGAFVSGVDVKEERDEARDKL